jgi:hypothetical protein
MPTHLVALDSIISVLSYLGYLYFRKRAREAVLTEIARIVHDRKLQGRPSSQFSETEKQRIVEEAWHSNLARKDRFIARLLIALSGLSLGLGVGLLMR